MSKFTRQDYAANGARLVSNHTLYAKFAQACDVMDEVAYATAYPIQLAVSVEESDSVQMMNAEVQRVRKMIDTWRAS